MVTALHCTAVTLVTVVQFSIVEIGGSLGRFTAGHALPIRGSFGQPLGRLFLFALLLLLDLLPFPRLGPSVFDACNQGFRFLGLMVWGFRI